MTRLATILALIAGGASAMGALVYLCAVAASDKDWLVAIVLGAAVVCGICRMAPEGKKL